MATIWTPEVIARETARKKAAGEDLNYGKTIPKTTNQGMSASQAGATKTVATGGAIPGTTTGAAASGVVKQAQGVSASQAGVGTTQGATKGAIPPIYNAATNTTGAAPALGYGSGGTYGQTAGLGEAYKANSALIGTDAGKQSEIARTQAVIAARKAQGLDTSGQEKYLSVNLGYKPEEAASGDVPNDGMLTSDQIAQEAQYKLDKERADLVNATTTQSNTVKNNADYANKLINDSRVLEDLQTNRTLNPFSGKTSYDKAMIGRGRGIDDTYRGSELTNQLNSISQDLYNFDKLAPDKQRALINEATRIEREYGLQVGALTGQIPGMGASGQTLASKQFEYGQTRDQVADNQWQQQFDEDKARYGEQFAYQKARDKITDANDKRNFDEQVRQNGISAAVSWYNAKTSSANAATSAASLAWSKDPTNPDNIYKNKQIEEMGNKLDPKLSSNNAFELRQELLTNKPDANTAYQYLQSQAGNLSSADYEETLKWIRDGMKPPKSGGVDLMELFGGGG